MSSITKGGLAGHKRLFVAIDLPQSVIQYFVSIQQALAQQNLFQERLTKPEHLHLTLKFIGEVDVQAIQRCAQALRAVSFPRMSALLGLLGLFSQSRGAAIVWIAVEADGIEHLARALDDVLKPWTGQESRPFVSHITIARIKAVPDQEKLLAYLAAVPRQSIEFEIAEFVLKESVLSEQGPTYHVVERYALHAAAV